jgi:hypothetical protein
LPNKELNSCRFGCSTIVPKYELIRRIFEYWSVNLLFFATTDLQYFDRKKQRVRLKIEYKVFSFLAMI